ncbi:hypothetical protein RD792_016276 [Penstemon davidsonii]|uniref:Uncharacterized protein n=1 Tax=Penstemon davidsonii TaxID=160366 RepID=A0ABR0CK20_9LAMI|nr:hypothetical protein RD792_016276 [Penstemon davidsonii]
MLRKRTRSYKKDQLMNHLMHDAVSESYDFSSQNFFNVPGLFVGFNPKTRNLIPCPKLQNEGSCKSWDCSKVGLSIVDSLADETKELGKVIRISDIQRGDSDVIFEIGDAPFEQEPFENFRACLLDSRGYRYRSHFTNFGNRKSGLGSDDLVPENKVNPMGFLEEILNRFILEVVLLVASEIELSEDYKCLTTHGPNPKVTHIFDDYILEHRNEEITDFSKKKWR